jgi:uncharacterized repeat protein (TIGR03943 family)
MVSPLTPSGAAISMLVGAVLLRLSTTGTYRRYLRVGMGPWLTVAGVAVILVGTMALVSAIRRRDTTDGHGHAGEGLGVGWLLLAPIAALLLVAPPTLGSYGVERGATVDVRAGAPVFVELVGDAGPVPMTLLEFGQRAFEQDGASFNGVPVRLTGFVAGPLAGGFLLARFQIACCAADAAPVVVGVVGVSGDPPARDAWVSVTGVFESGGHDPPRLAAISLSQIPEPDDPYES